ncbi:MAG: thioredoxin family protein [Candidatus Marinimicrobia bacterium]|nr:thioredoxin family protein [Candidatus Neomarinimicrobiota bacterium]
MKKLLIITVILVIVLTHSCTKKAEKNDATPANVPAIENDYALEASGQNNGISDTCAENHECQHHDELKWGTDIDNALKEAAITGKMVMVDFMADWCPPCRQMEKETFPNPDFIHKAENFILVRINVDHNQEIANKFDGNAGKYGGKGIPNILFMDKDKTPIRHIVGFHTADALVSVMDSVVTGKYQQ